MKKVFVIPMLILALTVISSGQDFWHVKATMQGLVLKPGDDNGLGYGLGTMVTFGYLDGTYDIGFEVQKWWRNYDLFDRKMDSLSNENQLTPAKKYAENKQEALGFAALARYKFLDVFSDYKLYSGAGAGFYFIQVNREEARQNVNTGLWEILNIDYYLETKAQVFAFLGLDGSLSEKMNVYMECRMTYVPDWTPWDDWWDDFYGPDVVSGNLGLRYIF
ncbi:MAG: hypothetical protein B6D58_04860 [candidate division Zixibacteria bacterium 4484_95]|nr:MAG: hypothetical protein B6D58_04860 [candidate division Zixibacteria bacterium 4484_95]